MLPALREDMAALQTRLKNCEKREKDYNKKVDESKDVYQLESANAKLTIN